MNRHEIKRMEDIAETVASLTYLQSPLDMLGKRRTFRMICDWEYPQGLRSNASIYSAARVTAIKGVVASDAIVQVVTTICEFENGHFTGRKI